MENGENHVSLNVVDANSWSIAEDPLRGTRVKNTIISPSGGHYVFKEPKERREAQIWSELISSFIAGDLLGWPTQTTSVAKHDNRFGSLHAYIYDPRSEEMTEGFELCIECDPEFDMKKGTRHCWPLIRKIFELDKEKKWGLQQEDFSRYWAKALAFDTLISNGDRHAENWAIIRTKDSARMAPLYDNGSSLGCGIDDVGLRRWFSDSSISSARLAQFAEEGRHHLRIDAPDRRGSPFNDVNKKYLSFHPEHKDAFEQCAEVSLQPVENLLTDILALRTLPEPYSMTEQRASHIVALLNVGQERLRSLLSRERIR